MGGFASKVSNPLTLIALFAAVAEGVGGFVAPQLVGGLQSAVVAFVIFFPILVFGTFALFLWFRPENLYAPSDFQSDEGFMDIYKIRRATDEEVQQKYFLEAKQAANVGAADANLNGGATTSIRTEGPKTYLDKEQSAAEQFGEEIKQIAEWRQRVETQLLDRAQEYFEVEFDREVSFQSLSGAKFIADAIHVDDDNKRYFIYEVKIVSLKNTSFEQAKNRLTKQLEKPFSMVSKILHSGSLDEYFITLRLIIGVTGGTKEQYDEFSENIGYYLSAECPVMFGYMTYNIDSLSS